jgi:Hint domain
MATFSVWARGDSSTANNASLNVQGTNKTPTTLLTFSDDYDGDGTGGDGDLNLDIFISGAEDPDTVVFLGNDPTAYTFTVEFGGTLPFTNKLSNVNGTDLRGADILVLTVSNGQRYFFVQGSDGSTFWFNVMNAFPNGAHSIENVFVCYLAGTLIDTPEGPRAVESLRIGDEVSRSGGGAAIIRHVATRRFSAREVAIFPTLLPLTVPAGHLAPGVPSADLTVSALHRILVRDADLERLFGCAEAFVAARDLPGVRAASVSDVTYVHFMCDAHECVIANGCESESLYPGEMALAWLGAEDRAQVTKLVGGVRVQTAYPCLSAREAAVWREAVQRREKRTA